jgi:hypothetical protein
LPLFTGTSLNLFIPVLFPELYFPKEAPILLKQIAAILLALYALSMLSYGSLEMGHDLLHWMATHYHSELHNHEHSHHHTYHDHEHHHDSHDHHRLAENDSAENTEFPSLIHFFLYYQQRPSFSFIISNTGMLEAYHSFPLQYAGSSPSTPPPQIV